MLQNIEHNVSSSVCFQMCIQPPSPPLIVAYNSRNYTTDHVATLSAAQLQKIEHNTC